MDCVKKLVTPDYIATKVYYGCVDGGGVNVGNNMDYQMGEDE
jgi:hypothetical protein